MATLTVYPEPGTTASGSVRQQYGAASGVAWSTLVADAGSGTDETTPVRCIQISSDSGTDDWRNLVRGIFLFDTSALGSSASISAATFSLYQTDKGDDLSITPNINVYSSNPASNTSLANGDYDSLGTTAFATAITFASFNSGYNDFTLNASGIAAIAKTGITKYGTRNAEYDAADSAPTWSSSQTSYLECSSADETGTTQDPKLVITYTAATNTSNFFLMF